MNHYRRFFTAAIAFYIFLFTCLTSAQPKPIMNSSEIKLALKKLNVTGSVLYIAAHPDDENTAFLSYMSSEQLVRTGYLALTRGDGGQNLIGDEQGDELGVIRTQELLQARKNDGAEQFFTRAIDFGYTKSAEECFKIWDKEKILYDVVWVVRKFRPDVIVLRFPGTGQGGHGQHTASAILALEAFKIANDPNVFPDQLKYVDTWQPKRIFWNAWTPALKSAGIDPDTLIKVNLGKYNSLLGKSYTEIAAISRTNHKSQGFGAAGIREDYENYFLMLSGEPYKNNMFDGIDLNWDRVNESEEISKLLKRAEENFDPDNPSAIVPDLVKAYSLLQKIDNKYWKEVKSKELKEVIRSCCGIWIEAISNVQSVTPGDSIHIKTGIVNRSDLNITLDQINLPFNFKIYSEMINLNKGEMIDYETPLKLPEDLSYSHPYWLRKKHGIGMYDIENVQMTGEAQLPPVLQSTFVVNIEGTEIEFTAPVFFRVTDLVDGELYYPLEILPPVTISFDKDLYLFKDLKSKEVVVTLTSQAESIEGKLMLEAEDGWKISPSFYNITLNGSKEEKIYTFSVIPSESSSSTELKAKVVSENKTYDKSLVEIKYKHINKQVLTSDAECKLVKVDIGKTTVAKIGYLNGSGDKIPEALRELGFEVDILSDNDFSNGNLQQYDAIITGIRAYNTEDRISVYNESLLNYVNNGGTLLVQYNTTSGLKLHPGVYTLTISHDRVTEENSPVKFLDENNPLLNYPNKITLKDFNGWIQERGLYFPREWDKRYQPLLEMNDTGETPSRGSLLYADYGKGVFIYTGLSFFRQLPAGVPGAIRLFVNLISAGNHGS